MRPALPGMEEPRSPSYMDAVAALEQCGDPQGSGSWQEKAELCDRQLADAQPADPARRGRRVGPVPEDPKSGAGPGWSTTSTRGRGASAKRGENQMNIGGGEAADQLVRMLLSGDVRSSVRLTGSALKNLLALTAGPGPRSHKKLTGKVNAWARCCGRHGICRQFPMTPEQYKEFQHRARKQKLLFATVRDRDGWGKLIDVILPVTELDRANQIFQRMLYQEPDRQPEAPTPERERTKERTSPEKGPQERQRHPKTPTARQDPQTPTQGRQSGQTAPHQADPPKKESRSGRGSRDTRTSSSTPQGQGTMTERPSVEGRLRAYRAQLERSSVPAKEKTKSRPKTR